MKLAYFSCAVVGLLISATLHSQYYLSAHNQPEPELLWELGVSAGAMNCLTDIGGAKGIGQKFIKDINWNQTQFCGSLFAGATWHSWLDLRLAATMGQITGNDNVLKNMSGIEKSRYLRNLHFKTSITEVAATAAFHPLPVLFPERDPPLFSPYVMAGIGFFYYNPQAKLNNVWVDLRPLHTEGEGFKEYAERREYKPGTWCFPLGAGIKYDAGGLLMLRLEMLYRLTGTDYLDDVSNRYIDPSLFKKYLLPVQAGMAAQLHDRSIELTDGIKNTANAIRGNPSNKDAYFSFHFSISVALGRIEHK